MPTQGPEIRLQFHRLPPESYLRRPGEVQIRVLCGGAHCHGDALLVPLYSSSMRSVRRHLIRKQYEAGGGVAVILRRGLLDFIEVEPKAALAHYFRASPNSLNRPITRLLPARGREPVDNMETMRRRRASVHFGGDATRRSGGDRSWSGVSRLGTAAQPTAAGVAS